MSKDSQDRAGDQVWQDRWKNDRIGFHKTELNANLVKHVDALLGGRQACTIFFPLCGKAVDMKWLADMGHTVVGVELCEKPLMDFYNEQKVEYNRLPVEGMEDADLFKSKDGKLQLYRADLFKLSSEIIGQFDCIYDRGALVALAKADRQRYVDLMISLMKPECNYMICIVDYDSSKMTGPPFDVPHSVLKDLYGSRCNLTILEKDVDGLSERHRARGIDWLLMSWYLMTLK